jgi:hypothetical protein
MKTDYNIWLNTKQEEIKAIFSPSSEVAKIVRAEIASQTGSDNYYDNPEMFDTALEAASTQFKFKNKSFNEVQTLMEPLRIANPDSGCSLYTLNGDFIGNVTWNDQMSMFWEYETYSDLGKKLASLRKQEAEQEGLIASWE